MAKTVGLFGGFNFDPEVFAEFMAEKPTWNDKILASGILQDDPTIMALIGEKGNVATLPFYKPLDYETFGALNNDGKTNNTPNEISGGKQTAMLIQRMIAFKAQDFTKELTGADPMEHIANSIADYYQQVWSAELMNIVNAVMGIDDMKKHVFDIASSSSTVGDTNKIDETTMIYAQQKALGDSADGFGLAIMNSAIYARYQALGLVNFNKYTVVNGIEKEVTLPTINGLIPLVTDRGTVRENSVAGTTEFVTTLIGRGAILSADKTNYENPYYTDYDPETNAGIEKLYTKQGKVLHPNGFSFDVTKSVEESPKFAELGDKDNWSLAFEHKNVKIGQMISNG